MAIHSSILAWRIPWTEKPGGLQTVGSQGVGHRLKRLSTRSRIHLTIHSSRQCGVCATVLNSHLLGPLAEEQEGIHLEGCQPSYGRM